MKRIGNVLHITKAEYERVHDPKGVIGSEYTDEMTGIRKSFMWNRTLIINGRLYIDGFNMAIE